MRVTGTGSDAQNVDRAGRECDEQREDAEEVDHSVHDV
jgi:hypothetical protein